MSTIPDKYTDPIGAQLAQSASWKPAPRCSEFGNDMQQAIVCLGKDYTMICYAPVEAIEALKATLLKTAA